MNDSVVHQVALQQMQQAQLQALRLNHLSRIHDTLLEAALRDLGGKPTARPLDANQLADNAVRIGDALLVAMGLMRKP